MTYRIPYLVVNGPGADGSIENLVPGWGSKLIGVKIVSALDPLNDELTIMFANPPPYMTPPSLFTEYSVAVGWSADDTALTGTYTLQRVHLFGNPKEGEQIHLICRSGLMRDEFNEVGSAHFSADNGNTTLGDTFRNLFKESGKPVEVSPEIAGKPLPGAYHLQWNETAMDSAQDLARDNRAVVKVMNDKILVLALDSGQSVSGTGYGTITIVHDPSYEYDIETESRFDYASIGVAWFDKDKGRPQVETSQADGSGQSGGLPHPAPTQDAAQAWANSVDAEWGREETTGYFLTVGNPAAVAGAFVQPSGFPPPIDTLQLQAETVTHDVVPGKGWTTTIEVKNVPND